MMQIPKTKPDVVLMDIHLPGESGITCTAKLKARLPDLQIIILTVYKDTELIFNALKAGANGCLIKRAQTADILDAITEVHSGGAPMTGEIARLVVRAFQPSPSCRNRKARIYPRAETEILALLSEGITNKDIASRLGNQSGNRADPPGSHLPKVTRPKPDRGRHQIPQGRQQI